MSIFNWPYTNFHELNLDWVLRTMKTAVEAVEHMAESMAESLESYAQRLQQAEQDIDALEGSRVSYAAEQQLTTTQKQRARVNIDAAPAIGVVYYNQEMALDNTYKARARDNIGAAAASAIPDVSDVVRTSAQTLTTEQQAQARDNIGAAPNNNAVQTTVQMFTDSQKMRARSNINAAEEPTVVDYTQDTGAITIEAIQNDHIYEIGNGATSVTITSIYPAAKSYMIVLTTGSTAPTVTGLSGVKGLENWAPDANTIYEISVYDNRAVVGSWEVTT